MAKQLFPYQRLKIPALRVTCSTVVPDLDRQEVNLSQVLDEDQREVELQLELELDPRDRELPDDLQVAATLHCKRTNLRQSVALHPSEIDRRFWYGSLEVSADNCKGPSRLSATVAGSPSAGDDTRILAESGEWTIFVDDLRDGMPAGGLKVKWVNFSEHDFLKTYRNDPYYLEFEEDSEPVVWLNGEMDELRAVLPNHNPPHGALAALYEATRTSIAKSVWQSLAQISISGIVVDEDNPDLFLLPYEEWQRQVLKLLLPAALDAELDDALINAAKARNNPAEARSLAARIALVISHGIVEEGKAIRVSKGILDRYI